MKTDTSQKLLSEAALISMIGNWRDEGLTFAFTNGVFDILHRGHLTSLERAASYCDRLIVGVNSDNSARRLNKGVGRPINNEAERAGLISGFQAVDAVIIFDEDTPYELLKMIRPDVLVKGGDYQPGDVAGREFAGRVEIIELISGLSTSSLIDRVRDLPD